MFLEVGRPESVGDTVASLTVCGSVSCRVPGAGEGEGQPGSPRQGAELCLSSLLLMSDLLTGSQGRGRGAAGLPSGVLLRRHPSSAKTMMRGRASPVGFRVTSDHLDRTEHWLVPSKAHLPGDLLQAVSVARTLLHPRETGLWAPGTGSSLPALDRYGHRLRTGSRLQDAHRPTFSSAISLQLAFLRRGFLHAFLVCHQPRRTLCFGKSDRPARPPPGTSFIADLRLPLCGALTRGVGLTVVRQCCAPSSLARGCAPRAPRREPCDEPSWRRARPRVCLEFPA